jgi:hypothetical protein
MVYHRIALAALILLGYLGIFELRRSNRMLAKAAALVAIAGAVYCLVRYIIQDDVQTTAGVAGIVAITRALAALASIRVRRRP